MKRYLTIFVQALIVTIGAICLTALLVFPQGEGRNVNATQFEIYFNDPFLAYVYLSSVPFFIGIYQAFRLVGFIRADDTYSERSARALGLIKLCAIAVAVFFAGAIAYIWIFIRGTDDVAGGVMMALLIIVASAIVAATAAALERSVRKSLEI